MNGSLRYFIAGQLLLQIYALSAEKFPGFNLWLEKKANMKYDLLWQPHGLKGWIDFQYASFTTAMHGQVLFTHDMQLKYGGIV